MEETDSCQWAGVWMKEGEGMSQRSYMQDPKTQTSVRGWPEGRGCGSWAGVGKEGENGDVRNRVNNKLKLQCK